MKKYSYWFLILLAYAHLGFASKGNFFRIIESGISAPLSITLCLNGTGPVSCQDYSVNHLELDITTVPPRHSYPNLGIKVNTPGYTVIDGCTEIGNGFCIFSASDTSVDIVDMNTTTVTDPGDVTLTVSGSPLSLVVNGPPGSITVNNTSSTVTAMKIVSNFKGTALFGKVRETGNTCASVAPNSSCTLTFTPGSSTVSSTRFVIDGTNTRDVSARISINPAGQAGIMVTGSPLSLMTNGNSGTLTIKNTSSSITATNITSNFNGTALSGNVTETGNTCSSVAPGASCTLTFTPGATAVDETEFTIQGSNTSSITAEISITQVGNAQISVSNSPIILDVNGLAESLTITNLSNTITATNIASNFTGTALAGKVTESGNTCSSVAPGGTCTLTYTPGSSAVALTTFSIQGTNTDKIHAAIKIESLSIGTDFGGGKVACLTSLGGSANLIAAEEDAAEPLIWSNTQTSTGATSTTNGSANTSTIVAAIGNTPAFAAPHCSLFQIDSVGNTPCQSGHTCYNDWYLPATTELNCLDENQAAIGGFSEELYWTSTEINKKSARTISFRNNTMSSKNKTTNELNLRCVRSFTP